MYPIFLAASLASISFMFIYSLATDLHFDNKTSGYRKWIYYPTHSKISQWLIGVTLGYIVYQTKDQEIKIKQVSIFFLANLFKKRRFS